MRGADGEEGCGACGDVLGEGDMFAGVERVGRSRTRDVEGVGFMSEGWGVDRTKRLRVIGSWSCDGD
jgi:hypothetical protein